MGTVTSRLLSLPLEPSHYTRVGLRSETEFLRTRLFLPPQRKKRSEERTLAPTSELDRLRGHYLQLTKQSIQITHDNYRKSKYQALIGNVPDILTISKWNGNRVQDSLIARIISKTIITPGLLHRFNLHSDPLCIVCKEINDISHILLKCKKYAPFRAILWNKLNIVESNITYDVLLSHALTNKNLLAIFIQVLKYFHVF
ncbi:hypothetical protein AVEN_163755-1 [Araneus ventricosus]|uniref:Reverse transcriptase zinc-binding domain-containing protein n=1 Tax=Araneus ventricosus TaxID=182803 RepID=A0A4Y2V416_ARAVE|nr:hypothetical protein AVEN_163755-1 [Araneus ventricosus]